MTDETNTPPDGTPAPAASPSQKPAVVGKPLQPRMKATGQKSSKERGAHTHHKKNPGKRAKKGGS